MCYKLYHNVSVQGAGLGSGVGWWGVWLTKRRGGWIKQCHWNPQCCESPIPFSFIKPISRRGELREEALNLSSGNNGALKG